MPRGFLSSIASVVLLAALVVLAALAVWQQDRMERRQIELLSRIEALEERPAAVAEPTVGSGEPDVLRRAMADPRNLLSRDPLPWLPADAPRGGTLRLRLNSDPKGLNFLSDNGSDVHAFQTWITTPLIARQRGDSNAYGPQLAHTWYAEDDERVYVFHLRDDFTWHEPAVDWASGRYEWLRGEHRVTAHDVEFMVDLMMNPQVSGAAPVRSSFDNLVSYEAVDDFTFRMEFSEPLYSQRVAMEELFPLPRFLYAFDEDGQPFDPTVMGQRFDDHWYNPRAIGCGAYRFVAWDPGVSVTLERSERYPLGGNAFDKIVFRVVKDANAAARMLRTRELDLTSLRPEQYRQEFIEGDPDSPFRNGELQRGEFWEYTYYYVGWNADSPYFGDRRTRWAMSHAFNADLLLDEVFMGLGTRTTGPMATTLPFYDPSIPPVPFDLDRASALLDEAGWIDSDGDGIRDRDIGGGQRIPFEFSLLVYGSSSEFKRLGTIFKEDLARIGVKMHVQPLEWASLLKRLDDRDFEAVTLAWAGSPDVHFRQIWHSSQADEPKSSNRVGFRNAEADALIEELERTFDFDQRVALAHRFHRVVYDEQPYTFFFTRKRPVFWQPWLGNVRFAASRPHANPRHWYFQSAPQR